MRMKMIVWWIGIVLCIEANSKEEKKLNKNFTDSIMRMETQIRSVRAKFVLKELKMEEEIAADNLGTRIFEQEKEIREIIENEISNITDDDLDKVRSLNMLKEVVTNFDITEKSEVLHAIDEKVKSLNLLKAEEIVPHPKNIYKVNPTVIEQTLVEDARQHEILEASIEVPKTPIIKSDMLNVESDDENYAKMLPTGAPIVSFEHTYGFDDHTSSEVIEHNHDNPINKILPVELPDDNKKALIPLGPTFEYTEKEEEDGDEEITPTTPSPNGTEPILTDLQPIHIPTQPDQDRKSAVITPEPTVTEKFCAFMLDLFGPVYGHPPLAEAKLTLARAPSPKRKRDIGAYCACDELKERLFGPSYM